MSTTLSPFELTYAVLCVIPPADQMSNCVEILCQMTPTLTLMMKVLFAKTHQSWRARTFLCLRCLRSAISPKTRSLSFSDEHASSDTGTSFQATCNPCMTKTHVECKSEHAHVCPHVLLFLFITGV